MPAPATASVGWTVLVPVKRTTVAKTRLSSLGPQLRRQLAVAFASDTIVAVQECPDVGRVVVITNDDSAHVFAELGAEVVADRPDDGINAALAYGAGLVREADGGAAVAAIAADLPALRPEALSYALRVAAPAFFVADADGVGTTLVAAAAHTRWQSHFGPDSRAQHRRRGLAEVTGSDLDSLRRDVDTAGDLEDARRLGLGVHTRAVLAGPPQEALA